MKQDLDDILEMIDSEPIKEVSQTKTAIAARREFALGNYLRSAELCRADVALKSSEYGSESPEAATAHCNLGEALKHQGIL